jgi:hypothetical protein
VIEARPNRSTGSTGGDLDVVLFHYDLGIVQTESLHHRGVRLVLVHRLGRTADRCTPGEEVSAAFIVHKGRDYNLSLSTALLILLDFLGRHRGIAQNATQIAMRLNNEPFYVRHASYAGGGIKLGPRSSRTSVKQRVMRLRKCLCECFAEAGIDLDPTEVLCSEKTDTNEVRYCLHANVSWEHRE